MIIGEKDHWNCGIELGTLKRSPENLKRSHWSESSKLNFFFEFGPWLGREPQPPHTWTFSLPPPHLHPCWEGIGGERIDKNCKGTEVNCRWEGLKVNAKRVLCRFPWKEGCSAWVSSNQFLVDHDRWVRFTLRPKIHWRWLLSLQNSCQFMRHAKRKKLTHEDINKALRHADVQVLAYGHKKCAFIQIFCFPCVHAW